MRWLVVGLAMLLAGCGGPATPPTKTKPEATQASITFPAADGTVVHGTVTGVGGTTVILSNMGDNDPAPWQAFAPALAAHGFTVLTYAYRYPRNPTTFTDAYGQGAVDDLTGAVTFARGQGAKRIVLIGASLGGIVTGKIGGAVRADAVAIVSAPPDLAEYGLTITPAELAGLTQPKLFVASRADATVPYERTRAYFDRVPEPKEWFELAGDRHGVRILDSENGGQLRDRLISFVTRAVPG